MKRFANVFACLVHESQECVVDLVRNLRALDPDSAVLLYNGGADTGLLDAAAIRRSGAAVHPSPKRMRWGRLHDFALDAMRFALSELDFDALTIVDSDQLALRPGYSRFLPQRLSGSPRPGLLGSAPQPQTPHSHIEPVRTFFAEIGLWRPFLRQFPGGEDKPVYWTFWPATVFTAEAARELTRFWDRCGEINRLLAASRLWATEEVLLPTLVALLGFEIASNPAAGTYVQYRRAYTPAELENAFRSEAVYWMHPVPRRYDDPLRVRIRRRFNEYRTPAAQEAAPGAPPLLLRPYKILETMRRIEGWLEDVEGDLLLSAALETLRAGNAPCNLVEIGSYCGRSTSVLAGVAKTVSPASRVFAIDPHDGLVGALDGGLRAGSPTLERFRANLAAAGVAEFVEPVLRKSYEVRWEKPVHLLLIDGLHDYVNVSRDFFHFEPWIADGGFVLFHDYASYYPGVMAFVDELLAAGGYRRVELAHTLMLLQKTGKRETGAAAPAVITSRPLVSCIMPTANRRPLAARAVEYFRRQDYPNLELVVVDDGEDRVEDLLDGDPRIRYERLETVRSMGAKHNRACELARGEVILHWDDDDWMAAWRVSYQVAGLLKTGGAALCGLSTLLFYDPESRRAWRYVYPAGSRPWVSGGTFCYRRRFWESHRFPEMNEGADTRYVWSLPEGSIHAHTDHDFYVATIHRANTSPRRLHDPRYTSCPAETVESLLGADLEFYRNWPPALAARL